MEQPRLNWITNFIWVIADDVLRDVYVRGKYRDIILSMTVIRRLDAILEPTKNEVLAAKKRSEEIGLEDPEEMLKHAAGEAFYNVSPFTFWFGELLRAMNLNQYSQSAAQPGLSVERIENIGIPVPDYKEQKRISDWINAETLTINTTVKHAHREIELIREYRTRLISDVVTGKLDVRGVDLPDPDEQGPGLLDREPIEPKAPNNIRKATIAAFDSI